MTKTFFYTLVILLFQSCNAEKVKNCAIRENICSQKTLSEPKAMFISFTLHNYQSATQIVQALAKAKIKTPVNLVASKNELSDESFKIKYQTVIRNMRKSGLKLNQIILDKAPKPPVYMRDLMFLDTLKQATEVMILPYNQDDIFGPDVANEIGQLCQFKTNYTFPTIDDDVNASINVWNIYQRTGLMGGNILKGPFNTLFIGEGKKFPSDKPLSKFFNSRYKTHIVKIPSYLYFHIDEVMQFISDPGSACGFSILKISPIEAIRFFKTRPPYELITASYHPSFLLTQKQVSRSDVEFRKNLSLFLFELSGKYSSGKELDKREFTNLQEMLFRETFLDKNRNLTIDELLSNQSLLKKWEENDQEITKVIKEVSDIIDKEAGITCNPKIISLPFIATIDGRSVTPNPINGEEIEGFYFYSYQSKDLYSNKMYWDINRKKFTLGPRLTPYPALTEYVNDIIKKNTTLQPYPIKTRDYDFGGGNFHCATNTLREFCF